MPKSIEVRAEYKGLAFDVLLRPHRTPTSIKSFDIETVFHGRDDITSMLSEEAIDGIEKAACAVAGDSW